MRHLSGKSWLALAAIAGAALFPSFAQAAEISVPMDQVRMITFSAPVKAVYVGNPLIADVTVIDSTRVFLLGKNFGSTNLVALDENGEQIANDRITVLSRSGSVVTLHRGSAQVTLSCDGGRCQPAPVPGDAVEPFDAVNGQMADREAGIQTAAGEVGQ